jgi:hypothetical protein
LPAIILVDLGALAPGQVATVTVKTSVNLPTGAAVAPSLLNAWIDFNADLDWNDPGEQIFSVNYAVTGTGANPANAADFANGVLPSGTMTFAPNEPTKVITVNVAGDTTVELNETFLVTLAGATVGTTITTATAIGTIANDDTATLSINNVRQVETNGATTFVFTVSSTAPIDTAISLAANTGGGTAKPAQVGVVGADYQPLVNQRVNLAAGALAQTISV